MKFTLFMIAVCIGYWIFFQSEPATDISVPDQSTQVESVRNHEPDTLLDSIPWGWVLFLAAAWVVIRYVMPTGSARTIYQGSSRTKARNAMHSHIKNSDERVLNAIRGSDELGDFEAIATKDPYGNPIGYWTEDTDKYPK